MKKKLIVSALLIIVGIGLIGAFSQAQSIVDTNPNTALGAKYQTGSYGIDDFMILAINISRWILGIVGSLSLVMFVYGGFMFLISGGSSDSVSKAKKIITAAVIGLIIVFASYLIIKFVLGTIGINWNGQKITLTK